MKLVVFRGDAVETELRLTAPVVRIGRDSRNDIVLDDPSKAVSRFHAEIRLDGDKYFVADLKSRNGVWIGGQRTKGKTELGLGVPATLGPYELVLEDEVASAGFDDEPFLPRTAQTVVNQPVSRSDGPSRSGTLPGPRRAASGSKQRYLVWGGLAVAVLFVGGIAWGIISKATEPPPSTTTVSTPSDVPQGLLPPVVPPVEPAAPVDVQKAEIASHLEAARTALTARDYDGALNSLRLVLEADPTNAEAVSLKPQAEAAKAAASKPTPASPRLPPPPGEPQVPGIPKRPNEDGPTYQARVRRFQTELTDGKRNLEKEEFTAALNHLRAAQTEQPDHEELRDLLEETVSRQRKRLNDALKSGRESQAAGALKDARGWFRHALRIDPSSSEARERESDIRTQVFNEAAAIAVKAGYAAKQNNEGSRAQAIKLYSQITGMLEEHDQPYKDASTALEALRR